MEKHNLTRILSDSLYSIPDYQRGYAWEAKQWQDFAEDVDALIDENIRHHYTGTIVTYTSDTQEPNSYGTKLLKTAEVVDGQQRLTTSLLYLSVILNKLIDLGLSDYEGEKADFLYKGSRTRLSLNNDTQDIFLDLLTNGTPNVSPRSPHQKRLQAAHKYFKTHLEKIPAPQMEQRLKDLYQAITSKLVFTHYSIEEESEIGMTFELMNSRGKGLSILELLKNYFMHWVYRNLQDDNSERQSLTELINKRWKDTYQNIGAVKGNEDQVLRVAWILMCTPTPKNWNGYQGFKEPEYFPLRGFSERSEGKLTVKKKIENFTGLLAEVSGHYAAIQAPSKERHSSAAEIEWISNLLIGGNLANFLPILIAARRARANGNVTDNQYLELIQTLEIFLYRVFLFEGKRSNAGKSRLYSMAHELHKNPSLIDAQITELHRLINHYSSPQDFQEQLDKPGSWYYWKRLLRYTLFQYELKLLAGRKKPELQWHQIDESTIEHILPQTPKDDSTWRKTWSQNDIGIYLHDIGNLCLTVDNSRYGNKDFISKKGSPGADYCYANSDIRQERALAIFDRWTVQEVVTRRQDLIAWIKNRWMSKISESATDFQDDDSEDEELYEVSLNP